MAKISTKRTRSRQASNATLVGTLKDFGMKMKRLDKLLMTYGRDRKRQWYGSPQRVVLDLRAGPDISSPTESGSSSTTSSGDDYDHGYEEGRGENARHLEQMSRDRTRSRMPLAPRPIFPIGDEIEEPEGDSMFVDQVVGTRPLFPLAPLSLAVDEHSNGLSRKQSLLDFSLGYDSITPTHGAFPSVATSTSSENVYDPYDLVSDFSIPDTESFPWDFVDPFSTSTTDPAYAFIQACYSKMHVGDHIAPHMHDTTGFANNFPFAYLSPPLPLPLELYDMGNGNNFNVSAGNLSLDTVGDIAGSAAPASTPFSSHRISASSRESVGSATSDESLAVCFQRANLEYINAKLQAQEAYEHREEIVEEMARREKRAKARSKLKQIALLGEEARPVVTATP